MFQVGFNLCVYSEHREADDICIFSLYLLILGCAGSSLPLTGFFLWQAGLLWLRCTASSLQRLFLPLSAGSGALGFRGQLQLVGPVLRLPGTRAQVRWFWHAGWVALWQVGSSWITDSNPGLLHWRIPYPRATGEAQMIRFLLNCRASHDNACQ